jgi:hypothetical protein
VVLLGVRQAWREPSKYPSNVQTDLLTQQYKNLKNEQLWITYNISFRSSNQPSYQIANLLWYIWEVLRNLFTLALTNVSWRDVKKQWPRSGPQSICRYTFTNINLSNLLISLLLVVNLLDSSPPSETANSLNFLSSPS